MPEPHDLGEAPGDQGGAGVGTETQAIGDPGGDREHVLGGAAHLDPDDVSTGIGAKPWGVQQVGETLRMGG